MDAREALLAAVQARGESLAGLSRLLRRNPAYLQQYVMRGSPRVLPERDRGILARYLSVSEASLGAPPGNAALVVPRLDVAVSAGPGAIAELESLRGVAHFPTELLARLGLDGRNLSMGVARGDSMLPTVADGDEVLVDTADRRLRAAAGIFVLRRDGALAIKRLRRVGERIEVVSDNPDYPPASVIPDAIDVIGRVVWLSRRL